LQISRKWASGLSSSLPGDILVLAVTGAGRPGLRVEAAVGYRLRFVVGGRPFLWARIEPYWDEAWLIRAPSPPLPLLPPLRAAEARGVGHEPRSALWWRAWALHAVDTLRERALLLSDGIWCVGQVPAVTPDEAWDYPCNPGGYGEDSELPPAYMPAGGLRCPAYVDEPWNSWDHTPAGALLALRELGAGDAGRVRAWRKHARDGSLPPVLLFHARLLGKYVILDGHVRLAAALEEGIAPPLLAVWPAREHVRRVNDETRRLVWENPPELEQMPPEQRVEAQNRVVMAVFAEQVTYPHRPIGWPLGGGADAWRAEVSQRLRALDLDCGEMDGALGL
jgi:hypothetical protein